MKNEYEVVGIRRFNELLPGDKFVAIIHDIQPGKVTIRFKDGQMYTARSLVLPEARIGEESMFAVRENDFEGRIVLEMVKLPPETKMVNMLREALQNAGLVPNPENLAMGKNIIDNGLPVDASTLQKAAFFTYAKARGLGQLGAEAVVFLLRENMPAIGKTIEDMHHVLYQKNSPATLIAPKREYYRIPYVPPKLAELHVFKGRALNALLSVPTESLGLVEVQIQHAPAATSARNRITIELSSDTDTAFQLLSEHSPKLIQALAQKGISLSISPKQKQILEPFTILTPAPETASTTPQKPPPPPQRYTFDMRV